MAYERLDIEVTDNGSSRRVQRNLEDLGRTGREVGTTTARIVREGFDAIGTAAVRGMGAASQATSYFGGVLRDLQGRFSGVTSSASAMVSSLVAGTLTAARSMGTLTGVSVAARAAILQLGINGAAALLVVQLRAEAAALAIGRMGSEAARLASSFGSRAGNALGAIPGQFTQIGSAAQGAAARLGSAASAARGNMSSFLQSIRNGASSAAQAVSNMFGRFFGGGGSGGGGGASGAGAAAGGAARGINSIEDAARRASSALITMNTLMYSLQIGMIAVLAVRWADEWQSIQNKLDLVTSSTEELGAANQRLFEIAQRTRSGYADVVDLFQSLRLQAENLGLSMKATADLTETISMASQIGSRGPQQAAAGILQLTQAMALGRLSGQNLNSVLQSTPRISIAIAQGLGVTTSALRGLAEGKKLTADVITRALQGQARVIAEEFLRLKPTISSAFTVLNNAAIEFMGNLERSTGFASGLASVVILLSRNMDVLAMIVTAVGSALMVAFGGAVRRAIVATSLAIAANPIGAVIALVTSLVAAVIFLGDRFSVTSDGMVSALDYIKGAFSLLWDVVANFGETMSAIWAAVGPEVQGVATTIWEWISWAFMGILSIAKTVINAVIGLFVFTYNAVVITWNKLPAAIQNAFALAINWVAEKFEGLINSLIGGINALSSYFGMGQIGEVSIGRMADTGAMADYYGSLGRAAGNAFGTDYVGAVGDALGTVNGMVMDRARGFSQRRRAGGSELSDVPGVATPYSSEGAGSGGSGSNGRGSRRLSRAEMIQEEMTRIHDETVTAANTTYTYLDRAAYEALDKFNSGLRSRKDQSGNPFGVLNPQEEQAMLQAILGLDRAKRIQEARDDVMRQAIGPRLKYIETEEAIGQLLRSNTISAGEAERAYLDAAIEFYQTREDRVSGQMLGRLQIMKEMRNQAQPLANAMKSIWEEQTGPMREYQTALEAIAALERDRMLTAQQAADATRNATIDYLDTQTDAASGVTRALMKIQQEAANVAQQMETLFSNAFSNLEDTWVEFTKTGKFDLSSFFDGLQEDIARATFKQYISGPLAGFLEDKLGIKVPGLAGPVGESRNNPMWVRSADQVGGTAAFNALFVDTSKREANKGATNDPFGIGGAVDDMNGCFGTFTDDLGNTLDTGAQSFGNELGGIIGGLGSMLGGLIGGEAGGIISTIAQGASMILPALGIGFATGGSFTVRDRDDYGDFATGGGFTVGGGGGVDSQLVSFRASPGERVNIERAGQVGDKSGGGGVSVAFSIDARGADASVEQRIRAAIAEATPQIVTAARQGSAQDRRYEMSRMPVGSRKN